MVVHKGSVKGHTQEDQSGIPMKCSNIRKVFIQRDYSTGTATKFNTQFPEDLNGRVDRQQFEQFISHLNEIYDDAEKMTSRTCCESCISCLTAYFIYVCIETYYDKCMRRAAAFIEEQNETIFKRHGILVTDPIERGLRVIEITIFSESDGSAGGGGESGHTNQAGHRTNSSSANQQHQQQPQQQRPHNQV